VLKKTAATGCLLIAAATGALVTCSPAFATPAILSQTQTQVFGDHTRNWSGTENESFNHIRLNLHNRNNNIAVARNPHRDERRRPRPVITVTVAPTVG
jgi:hypothetical protein